jgi:hypothetical protein
VVNSEIASALARFFEEGKGPSHDELDRVFLKSNLSRFDPAPDAASRSVGKMKRVRGGLLDGSQADPAATLLFVKDLIAMLKARGCFIQGNDQYAGEPAIRAAQSAMRAVGWRLDASGDFYPASIAGLEGRDLSEALKQYVRRIQRASDDDALTIGSAKELLEAAARHVTVETTGSFDRRADFPTTLFRASTMAGTGVPTSRMIDDLDADAFRAVEQGLALTALAINRLRNLEGTGHGRPTPTRATRRQGIIAAQAAAAICYVLLSELTA